MAKPDCCQHAEDAAKWRRLEYTLKRAVDHGNTVDPEELLELADDY